MKNIDIEKLPRLVEEGKLSKTEAKDIIWTDIYLYPQKYGLSMEKDEKSDFLLYLQERLAGIFDDFEQGKILFRTYVWGFLRNTQQTWKRMMRKQFSEQESIRKSMNSTYEEECGDFYEKVFEPETDEMPEVFRKTLWRKKEREMAEKAALILTLKSCHELNEEIVKNVSKFIHIDKTELQRQIDKLKEKSDYKAEQREIIIRRRDNAFFYHRKYLIELQKLRKGSSTFERVQKKYQQQTENWIKQNKLLSHRFVLSPSNVEIAKELGMQPRQVCFYISHIKRKREIFCEPPSPEEQENETGEESPDH